MNLISFLRCFILLGMLATAAEAQPTVTILYSFSSTSGNAGYHPRAGLVEAPDGNYYGVAYQGGGNGAGTIYEMIPGGIVTDVLNFSTGTTGGEPSAPLIVGKDGNLYGEALGGTYFEGTVFEFTTTNHTINNFYSFISPAGNTPEGPMLQGQDGNFYGVTEDSATFGYEGTVYKLQTNGTITTLYSFTQTNGVINTNGFEPESGLVQGPDGVLYGTTLAGGTSTANSGNGVGTIFKITTNGLFQTMWSFNGTNGNTPENVPLIFGPDGNLYGTTFSGGTNQNGGTIFRISPSGNFASLVSLNPNTQGAQVEGGLLLGKDGNFYGTTVGGDGIIFELDTNGNFTTLYQFGQSDFDGSEPRGTLIQGSDGNIYGTTVNGGTNNVGTIFELNLAPSSQEPVILSEVPTDQTLTLTWSSVNNQNYQLQFCTDLVLSNWTNLGPEVTATGTTASGTDNISTNAQRFYRVLQVP
ncbi:MAG TPA: choice-of-anchor tandem repeat GloVer-containing protein [Pseudomonadales bacterium]|nr:choice-of-anchor tandem repeat GloVer-containing protein [Pseudomonadales bacterium]